MMWVKFLERQFKPLLDHSNFTDMSAKNQLQTVSFALA